MNRKLTAVAMITATVCTALAITALGAVFEYPDVLKHPASEILAAFRTSQAAVSGWFLVLALGAAMMIPIALGVGRLGTGRALRWSVPVGIVAGVVQLVGLLRWPLLVPGYAADASSADPTVAAAAEESFRTAHRLLGNVIGETLGYLFTAGWTLLVVVGLGSRLAGRWFALLGGAAAVLVLSGVLSPLDLPLVDLANLIGYGLWGAWLLAFAVLLLLDRRPATSRNAAAVTTSVTASTRKS